MEWQIHEEIADVKENIFFAANIVNISDTGVAGRIRSHKGWDVQQLISYLTL